MDKFAFITEHGKFSQLRLSFGTKNSSARFAELIDKVLGHFDKDKVVYFLGDVIIAANNIQEMRQLLEEVLQTLIYKNLNIESAKMQLCKKEIVFLGFKLHENSTHQQKKK